MHQDLQKFLRQYLVSTQLVVTIKDKKIPGMFPEQVLINSSVTLFKHPAVTEKSDYLTKGEKAEKQCKHLSGNAL